MLRNRYILNTLVMLALICHSHAFASTISTSTSFTVDADYVGSGCTQGLYINSPAPMAYDFTNGVLPQSINAYITCTSTQGPSTFAITANGGTTGNRVLVNSAQSSATLPYEFCDTLSNNSCSLSTLWPISSPHTVTCVTYSPTVNECDFSFYIQVPAQSTPPVAGNYYDTITFSTS